MSSHRGLTAVVAVIVALAALGSTADTEEAQSVANGPSARDTAMQDEPDGSVGVPADEADADDSPSSARGKPANGKDQERDKPEPSEPKDPAPRTYLVTRVIDGDTLELASGDDVRLVGIDTPEVGDCGSEKAAANLSYLTLGKQVTLTMSDEDRDHYDRLLRYVNVGGLDAGLRLIQNGLAIARYDSRDGYGFHVREPRYIAADRANPDVRCVAARPLVAAPPQGSGCGPGYTPCIPPFPPDVNCDDVAGPLQVTGDDPHGLDADGDGVACE